MSELTNIELETALDRVLLGDQGAAQRIIDHNKALRAKLATCEQEQDEAMLRLNEALGCLGYPVPSNTPTGNISCGLCEAKDDQLETMIHDRQALKSILAAILHADERGQGLPFQEAMERARQALRQAGQP